MFCIVAFVVLSILGIFSATNRQLAREALDCVLRRVTFRPCTTGFDEKMKAKILGKVINYSQPVARFLNQYFEALAWTFFLLFLASSIFAVRGLYLFYTTGSCNGLNQAGFCVFDPTGANNQISAAVESCSVTPRTASNLTLNGVDMSSFPVLNPDSKDKIVFIGCYDCAYTRETYPIIMSLARHYNASVTFLHYPVKESTDYMSKVSYCAYQQDPSKYWAMNDAFFDTDKATMDNSGFVKTTLTDLGYDYATFQVCMNDPATEKAVQNQLAQIDKTNFYGTPTVSIDGEWFVGPKPYRVYAIGLAGLLYWLK
ncbi:MAG TPA: thioredoxin domain-containing protein [Longilinea sp.]|nr:thioredoxin domain-containing protein [Longilinea sp.]